MSHSPIALPKILVFILVVASFHEAIAQGLDGCSGFVLPPFSTVQFDEEIQPIFDRSCVGCHQPDAEGFSDHLLDLRSGFSYRNLIDRPSLQSPWKLVEPFNPDGPLFSYLWLKISCRPPPFGGSMPPPPAQLAAADVRALYTWILRGAPPGEQGAGSSRPIELGHSGTWFDPSLPGHGFSFEILPGEPLRLIMYWMTFDLNGAQRWLIGTGEFDQGDSSVEVVIAAARAGVFDDVQAQVQLETVGSGLLSFASCTQASLRYEVQLAGDEQIGPVARTVALRRLTASPFCETTSGSGTDTD